ncbi:D-alanyl-D-alanine carboxypeptidase family protein [Alphaproteobacteria bacterium]|nr:D-alanyl-D-alanine carboxypeptidase family protein [Alphaproteobacteria bacterium]
MKQIASDDLIPLDLYEDEYPIRVQLDYARADNLLLGEAVYHQDARLWAHKDITKIVLKAAQDLHSQHGLRLVIYDCLRTTDAQQAMLETKRVQDNPHWLEEPRLLSPPGSGAHPRGMAIDVALETMGGMLLDMGTPFDQMCEDSSPATNRAHRDHPDLSEAIVHNRSILDGFMLGTARELGLPLIGLPEEWWDFRFPAEVYEQYAPISDSDLPEDMRIT